MQSLVADRVLKFSTMKALVEKNTHKTRIWFQDVKEKMSCSPQIFFSINNIHETYIQSTLPKSNPLGLNI